MRETVHVLTEASVVVPSMMAVADEFLATCHRMGSREIDTQSVDRSANATPRCDGGPLRRRPGYEDPLPAPRRCAQARRSHRPLTKCRVAPAAQFRPARSGPPSDGS